MIIVALLIGISLLIALIFLVAFFWNVRSGQYDDMFTPSARMLFDDAEQRSDSEEPKSKG
jgi:cbb3-type cytochrome oxidase maturation protein